jgi:hypothetical protein
MTILTRTGAVLAVVTAVGGGVTLHAVASSDDAPQHKSSTQQTLQRHDDNRRDQMPGARDDRVGNRRMHPHVRVIGHVCDAEGGSVGALQRGDDRGRHAEPGDDRGQHAQPGEDFRHHMKRGDDSGRHMERGDDSGRHMERGDDSGRHRERGASVDR